MTNSKLQSAIKPPTVWDVRKDNLSKGKLGGFVATTDTEINWAHTLLLLITSLLAVIGVIFVRPKIETIVWSVIMYFWTGFGITAGYHRLWSHRAYSARFPIRLLLCLGGAAAFEGSAKWWCRNHRAHHRYTDTDKDPYNARKGFWYAHMGWMLVKQNTKKIGFADITDLQKDSMIVWQHKYYPFVSIGVGVVFPTLVAGLWGDFLGGFFYSSMLRIVFVHHATFFVNSLAHTLGAKSYSDFHTAFDSFITAILTLGEGYHNYHHEFPQDYRNGIKIYHYDPTKWIIKGLHLFGLTYDLKEIPSEEVTKAKLQMAQRKIDFEKASLRRKFQELPHWTWTDIQEKIAQGELVVVIEGIIYDVTNFVHEHPGGRQTLLNWVGTDCTRLFEGLDGSEHTHSKQAREYLEAMKVACLKQ